MPRSSRPTDNVSELPDGPPDASGITPRQRRVLECIRESIEARGYPPSIREIGNEVGLTSSSSVAYQLRTLERLGFLRRDPNRPRALEVLLPDVMAARRSIGNSADFGFDETDLGNEQPAPSYVPLVGQIAAGGPILAEERVEEVFPLPKTLVGDGTLFLLEVKGDSMIDGEATVKTFQRKRNKVWLLPHNEAYDPIDGTDATILGKVTTVLRRM